jgi:hypothetical protein
MCSPANARRRIFAEGQRALRGYGYEVIDKGRTRHGVLRAFERRSAAPLEDAPTFDVGLKPDPRPFASFAFLRALGVLCASA